MGKIKLSLREACICTSFSEGNIRGNLIFAKYQGDVLCFSLGGLAIPETSQPLPLRGLRSSGLDKFNFMSPSFLGPYFYFPAQSSSHKNRHAKLKCFPQWKNIRKQRNASSIGRLAFNFNVFLSNFLVKRIF